MNQMQPSKITKVSSLQFRIESDALGPIKVPEAAMCGSFTVRARKLFNLSGQKPPLIFIKSLGLIKIAAAKANHELQELDSKLANAIVKAATEYSCGNFTADCQLDPFQAGAGTPLNMNANEIIANRANQILGQPLGKYQPIHPNNHVNMAQSTNDVIPTATRIAGLYQNQDLLKSLSELIASFLKQAKKYPHQIKVGRTHLQDAVPMTVAQEITAWAAMLQKDYQNLKNLEIHLLEIGLGGNAIGSGINSHPQFKKAVTKHLKKLTGFNLQATPNTFETNQSMTAFSNYSAGLRSLANDLIKIANDLKLLCQGPLAGIAEYYLPEVEPGSSIMPGKVNPSIVEALEMACYQVLGNDSVISHAASRGQLQLNIFAPLIMFNLLWSQKLLENAIEMFRAHCVNGLTVNQKRCHELFEKSLSPATALTPYLGYHETALCVNEALKKGLTLRQIILEKKLLSAADLEKIISPQALTRPRPKLKIK